MSGKGDVPAGVQSQDKRKSKAMSLLTKMEELNNRNRGLRIHTAGCQYGVSELTIHSIKKNEDKSGQVLMLVLQVQIFPV
jgi:hypothetical protein